MKDHYSIVFRGVELRFLPPKSDRDNAQIAIDIKSQNCSVTSHLHFAQDQVVQLVLLHRAIGEIIEVFQPGIINPLPDGDPSIVDAMQIIYAADVAQEKENSDD